MNIVNYISNSKTACAGLLAKVKAALAADKASKRDVDRRTLRLLALSGVALACITPELALAAPWDQAGTWVLGLLTGGLTRTIAIVAVIACGIAAMAGKLSWDWVFKIVIGIVLIFGGAAIVDAIIAAVA